MAGAASQPAVRAPAAPPSPAGAAQRDATDGAAEHTSTLRLDRSPVARAQADAGPPQPEDVLSGSAIWRGRLDAEFADLLERAPPRERLALGAVRDACAGLWSGDLPRLPQGASEILSSSRAGEMTIERLIRQVERDPALAALVIRTANSAAYKGVSRCGSLLDAIVRMGREGLANVALRYAVTSLMCDPGPRYRPFLDAVFEHLVQTGALCRELATPYGIDREEAYTLGLMHDIGKVMLCEGLARARRALNTELELPEQTVSELMRWLHEPLGGLTVEAWNMPSATAHRVAGHHTAVPDVADPLAEVLRVADQVHLSCTRGRSWMVEAMLNHRNQDVPLDAVEGAVRGWQFDTGQAA